MCRPARAAGHSRVVVVVAVVFVVCIVTVMIFVRPTSRGLEADAPRAPLARIESCACNAGDHLMGQFWNLRRAIPSLRTLSVHLPTSPTHSHAHSAAMSTLLRNQLVSNFGDCGPQGLALRVVRVGVQFSVRPGLVRMEDLSATRHDPTVRFQPASSRCYPPSGGRSSAPRIQASSISGTLFVKNPAHPVAVTRSRDYRLLANSQSALLHQPVFLSLRQLSAVPTSSDCCSRAVSSRELLSFWLPHLSAAPHRDDPTPWSISQSLISDLSAFSTDDRPSRETPRLSWGAGASPETSPTTVARAAEEGRHIPKGASSRQAVSRHTVSIFRTSDVTRTTRGCDFMARPRSVSSQPNPAINLPSP